MTDLSIAYIDADILVYRAVAYVDDEFDGSPVALPRNGLAVFKELLERWLSEIRQHVKLKDYFLCITVGKNFRHFIYKDYKANRKATGQHPALNGLKLLVRDLEATICEQHIEADDLIALRCTEGQGRFAVSADKDFLTVPCVTYYPKSHGKTEGTWVRTSLADADRQMFLQSMTGDTIDNYKGIEKCGPVKAAKFLEAAVSESDLWRKTLAAFQRNGYTEDYALVMVRLARILRHGEYDFQTQKITLWKPPIQEGKAND